MVTPSSGGARISVRAQPRSSREAIVGVVDDGRGGRALKVAVTAPPVEGAANEAIERVFASALGVPRTRVRVCAGATGRTKVVEVKGIDGAAVTARLEAILGHR